MFTPGGKPSLETDVFSLSVVMYEVGAGGLLHKWTNGYL